MAQDSEAATYNWSPQRYINLVENTKFPMLQEYQKVELDYLTSSIQSPRQKTFIDVGAGYGRVFSQLAEIAQELIAVELDSEMLSELRKRAAKFGNVRVIAGDANHLSDLLKDMDIKKPVVLSLQNSLGTWKGNYRQALEEMKRIAQEKHGEVVISLFRQETLKGQ